MMFDQPNDDDTVTYWPGDGVVAVMLATIAVLVVVVTEWIMFNKLGLQLGSYSNVYLKNK